MGRTLNHSSNNPPSILALDKLHLNETQAQLLTRTSPHLEDGKQGTVSCNYEVNTKVITRGANNKNLYDTSPRSCIKVNTNYTLSPPNEPSKLELTTIPEQPYLRTLLGWVFLQTK